MTPLILILGARTRPLAEQIKAIVDGEIVHVRSGEVARVLQRAFGDHRPIVGVCASGILVRSMASVLADKSQEPPVLAVAEDGSAVVPLLGGHRGANRLALQLANGLGGIAAITTASDLALGLALDEPPPGWRLAPNDGFARFVAARLEGEPCKLEGDAAWLEASAISLASEARDLITVTHRRVAADAHRLVYHPQVLALGVGCERGVSPTELIAHVEAILGLYDLSPRGLAGVFSLELKAAEPAIHALAEHLDIEARFFTSDELEREAPRLENPSEIVFAAAGCHGVAEGAALAAAGPKGTLIVPKTVGDRCTCAVALAPEVIDARACGRPRGHLAIVGIGPGRKPWRTLEAETAIRAAEDVVGYTLYLELIDDLIDWQVCHAFPLGEEAERCRTALELAARGRRVALVSSGDAGIYGMASLVMELLDAADDPAWERLALEFCPGVSAMQAASARAGAVLGHDFCAISLSDLMTPWTVIEARLEAAIEADFVIALYNPVSRRRREGFARALALLRSRRVPDDPVIIARNLGRGEEVCSVTTLGAISVDDVDMLTTVIIGNRQTRRSGRLHGADWVFTPRGYGVR